MLYAVDINVKTSLSAYSIFKLPATLSMNSPELLCPRAQPQRAENSGHRLHHRRFGNCSNVPNDIRNGRLHPITDVAIFR
jgi:hypothetical protein